MCDKKNSVLFTSTECLVLSPGFKLLDENQVLLRVSRENNMYNVDLKNIVPSGDLTCLFAKETLDESNLWHRRLGHINIKTVNKLVKGDLVRGLPTKVFENYHTCVACKKGKQHRASCKTKPVSSVSQPLQRLHIDLFGPTFLKSPNKKSYCLVVTDDYSRFTWLFFLATKDETSLILKTFITGIENQLSLKSSGSKNPQNTDDDAAFEEEKHESDVHDSSSSSAQIKKHDDMTKREAKGKKLEDITYSDDEEDVGAEADFTNLETTITVSHIPTTKVHKDHHINNDDFRTCMLACFLSQEEPKRVHQALKDPSWIKAMQEELLQFKMQKEEGIDYEEVFALVARIEAIRLFLAYASFMGFMVYQMDVKSAFLYGTIEKEIYVDDIIFGSTNKDLCKAFEKLMKDKFQMSSMGEFTFFLGLQVKQKQDGIFISQDKYVAEILRKFGLTDGKSAIKRIFRYLKGKPHLGLWYPKDSPLYLVAYSDSDYAGASLDIKSTTGGCQFLGCRLISWQCKKQTVVATSSTEAEYVAVASCYAQVLWIQNQLLDYGTSWNEFSSSMALAVICLSTGAASVAVDDVLAAVDEPFIPSPTPTTQPPPSQDLPSTSQGRIIANIDADNDVTLTDVDVVAKEDDEVEPAELQEVVKVVTTAKLMTEVVTAASATITAVTTLITATAITTASKPKSKDKGKRIMVEEPKPLKKQAQIEQDEAYARENMAGFKMDYFKGMSYDHISPIFEKKFNSNVPFLEKTREQMEEEDSKALKRTIPNDEDDVYTEATPLARKVPVVDYKIYTENNKPYYKIIIADGSPQLFLSFLSLLRNFNREDLEVLWKLVKERFTSSKPKNFSDDFLLTTLTYMFEKPDV
uniref:Putative ribonuclease H-like domain-containing protein n=1 Tax=Tanacetum cinerariifolium TaxID=118510 RepID=A0A6L2KVQ2_TANCI|nr:putative ribonuclease H-like domain-containing protein [Tanacetum cinerariifolium]